MQQLYISFGRVPVTFPSKSSHQSYRMSQYTVWSSILTVCSIQHVRSIRTVTACLSIVTTVTALFMCLVAARTQLWKLLNGQNLPALEALGLFVLQLCRRDSVVYHTAVNMGTPYALSMALFETIRSILCTRGFPSLQLLTSSSTKFNSSGGLSHRASTPTHCSFSDGFSRSIIVGIRIITR